MKAKTWFAGVLAGLFLVLGAFAAYIVTIDPFFHYHKPLPQVAYTLDNSRYQNDGLARRMEYDILITGTSMVSNFKTTQCDELFGGRSIKTPFHGASLCEINNHVDAAIAANPKLHTVIRCLDQGNLLQEKDYISYEGIPDYLYDNNLFNDAEYFLNKKVFILADTVRMDTADGKAMTSFDEYMNWQGDYAFGREAVLEKYDRPGKTEHHKRLTDEERACVLANIRQNVTRTAQENPDVTFYYFFAPYSICYWDVEIMQQGKLEWYMDLLETSINEIVACENIKLFGYDDNTELICDLNRYQDQLHYDEDVNASLLEWMKDGKGLLTKDNYKEYLETLYEFYGAYDYDSIYEGENGQ